MIKDLRNDIKRLANPEKAKVLQGFFKTGKGQYGEGDVFVGLIVPQSRTIAIKYKGLPSAQIVELFKSKIHEERLIAILILVHNFQKGNDKEQKKICDFYLKNLKHINNWDLVDLSADKILGAYLADKEKGILLKLAKSENIWSRRIAMIATYHFIKKQKSAGWTFRIAEMLLNDEHDLIHKAVGWMLRETGKNISQQEEEIFLRKHYRKMPRTMLRYAIEHFDPALRKSYMEKTNN